MAAIPAIMTTEAKKLSFAKVVAAPAAKSSTLTTTTTTTTTTSSVVRPGPTTNAATLSPRPVTALRQEECQNALSGVSAPVVVRSTSVVNKSKFVPVIPTIVANGSSKRPPAAKEITRAPAASAHVPPATRPPNLVVNGSSSSDTGRMTKTGSSQSPSENTSPRAESSSDLGTKPPSLDGKSTTSGTTFALDEKESLRPDDSASVQAAAEDDDSFSIRGSHLAGSRLSSELAARMHRIQIGDMPPRSLHPPHPVSATHSQGAGTPQSAASDKPPAINDIKVPLGPSGTTTPEGTLKNPDEKLLEAMQSSKDRLFLLKLEHTLVCFGQDSKDPFMDLPPCNSFFRMLTHKLADYYRMTHSFEPSSGSVRIFRTPFCTIRPSLSTMVASASEGSSPAPAVLPRRIMRRQDIEAAAASSSPSKAASEADSDSKNKGALPKEKLTREQREEEYNLARQRIFGNEKDTAVPDVEGDAGADLSRASSVSARDKASAKRKGPRQRRENSDSFETRSHYVAHYAPQQSPWGSSGPQFVPISSPPYNVNGQYPQPYPNAASQVYGMPAQPYPQVMPNNGYPPQFNAMVMYPTPPVPVSAAQAAPAAPAAAVAPQQQQLPQQPRYPPPSPQMGPYSGAVPAMTQPAQAWTPQPPPPPPPPPPQAAAQGSYPPARSSPVPPTAVPYPYGQLPTNANPHDPKSQHPIPGSYNRQAFNPKTHPFVPGANGAIVPPPVMQGVTHSLPPPGAISYGGSSPHLGGSPTSIPHLVGYPTQPMPPPVPGLPPATGYVQGVAYGGVMVRQESSSSTTMSQQQYTHVPPHPHMAQGTPPMHAPYGPNATPAIVSGGPHPPSMVGMSQSQYPHLGQQPPIPLQPQPLPQAAPPPPPPPYSHLPNYGNPATLPQKPSN